MAPQTKMSGKGMPWFRIVATVAAMEPSLFIPARIKIRAISKRPSAEMEETSAFIALSVFMPYHPALVRLSGRAIINTCAASFRDAGNASVVCAIAIQGMGFDFELGRYSEARSC